MPSTKSRHKYTKNANSAKKTTNRMEEYNNMKKLLCSIILTMLIIFGAVNCLAAEEETYYIYKAVNFEDHNVGDLPRMFTYHLFSGTHDNDHAGYLTSTSNVEVVNIEKDGNSNNLAMQYTQ